VPRLRASSRPRADRRAWRRRLELCVGDPEDEQNAASGDSGGPLFITNAQNQYEQIGLVSRGSTYIDDATDVVALRGWIDAEIAAWGRTTYCSFDGVTSMFNMFRDSSAFNQDISGWAVDSVTSMNSMFAGASSFEQDLGWCVRGGDVSTLWGAFYSTRCESTSCGVVQDYGGCVPTPAPTPGTDAAQRGGRVGVALVVGVMTLLA
jgi:surface protein